MAAVCNRADHYIFALLVKVKVKVAFISIIINDKNKLDTVITKN